MEKSSATARDLPARGQRAGFTLIEVVLALGIVAIGIIGVFGLLPAGLVIFRESQDASITAEIAQRIINDAQQTDFSTLSSPLPRYFDVQGVELSANQSQNSIYETCTTIKKSVVVSGRTSTNMATVLVNVANNPGKKSLTPNASGIVVSVPGVSVSTYSGLVSSN